MDQTSEPTITPVVFPSVSPSVSPSIGAPVVSPFLAESPMTPGIAPPGMPATPRTQELSTTPILPTPLLGASARSRPKQPDALIELIWTLTKLGRKTPEISKQLGIPTSDVKKLLTAATRDPRLPQRLDRIRADAARSYSSHLQAKGVRILDSITDDEVKKMAPAQRGVIGGIMVDKAKVLGEVAARIDERLSPTPEAPSIPQLTDIQSLVASIKSRVRRLTVLQVELDPDVRQKVEALDVQEVQETQTRP